MRTINTISRYANFVAWGNSGKIEDVDRLMDALVVNDDLATTKLVDYALGLIAYQDINKNKRNQQAYHDKQ